jgi:hypothetical protein
MIKTLSSFALAIGLVLPVVTASAQAAKLSAADRSWIETCAALRKDSKARQASLRAYCTCMHDVVEDNQPYGITELERSFPPVHELCWRRHRLR